MQVPASSIRHNDLILLPDSSRPHTVCGIYKSRDGKTIGFEIDNHHPTTGYPNTKIISVNYDSLISVA